MHAKTKGFTLIEILGAVGIVIVVSTIAVTSVSDTVKSGQSASMQGELQRLNTGLQNFKSAGGTIPDEANATEAVSLMLAGVQVSGGLYKPLTSAPAETMRIGATTYTLAYSTNGFSYLDYQGQGMELSGTSTTPTDQGPTLPFDPTSEAAVTQALADFGSMDPNSPIYAGYLSAFAAAMITPISDDIKNQINQAMDTIDYAFDENAVEWRPFTLADRLNRRVIGTFSNGTGWGVAENQAWPSSIGLNGFTAPGDGVYIGLENLVLESDPLQGGVYSGYGYKVTMGQAANGTTYVKSIAMDPTPIIETIEHTSVDYPPIEVIDENGNVSYQPDFSNPFETKYYEDVITGYTANEILFDENMKVTSASGTVGVYWEGGWTINPAEGSGTPITHTARNQ